MRMVFVNHCHPDTPHVCATRMRQFSHALTALGHEVILLTETLKNQAAEISPDTTGQAIQNHDFSNPLYLATSPEGYPLISALRNRTLPWGVRQAVIVWHYFRHKGVFTDWRSGSQPYLPPIAEHFNPDVIWTSFGNTDCWNIAKDLAGLAKCPWVADLKDLWSNFIPSPFQDFLSRHFNDCAALTTFSNFHSKDAEKWFIPTPTVIYSGVSESMLTQPPALDSKIITLSLTGAIYDETALQNLVDGIRLWLIGREEDKPRDVQLVYAGHDTKEVETATAKLSKLCRVDIRGYLPLEELRHLHQTSTANLYIKSNLTFHHKTIEMFSTGRPLICYPGETDEAVEIAQTMKNPFFSCNTSKEIASALEQSLNFNPIEGPAANDLHKFTWESQARELENLFQDVINEEGKNLHA